MAVRSMTGFGRATRSCGTVQISVEVRSVNHRFLDVVSKLPQLYSPLEPQLVKAIREKLVRGRVELFVTRSDDMAVASSVRFNRPLFDAYLLELKSLVTDGVMQESGLEKAVLELLARREILGPVVSENTPSLDPEALAVDEAVADALLELFKMRDTEGAALKAELEGQLLQLQVAVDKISVEAKSAPERFRERLNARLGKLLTDGEVDQNRLAQEVAILADRVDVTEELVRLRSHIEQFRALLNQEATGRKLDFLIQEMGREVNTTGSKGQSGPIAALIVDAKAILEKLKEQVQNIE